jgi:hypothetical protein
MADVKKGIPMIWILVGVLLLGLLIWAASGWLSGGEVGPDHPSTEPSVSEPAGGTSAPGSGGDAPDSGVGQEQSPP